MHAAELQEGVPKVVTSSQGLGGSGGGLGGTTFLVRYFWWKMYGKCMENHKGVNYKTHFLFGKCVWGKGHEMLITADRCVINHLNLQNMTGSL